MKKKIVAILAAVGLFSSGVFAGGTLQEISVSFDAVKKIVIFGQDKTPTEAKPFIYNGTTYVPLRYVSEQLKVPVSWDPASGTVYLGESPVATNKGAVSLVNQPMPGTYKAHLYRINNKLDASYNVDNDAGYSFPQTFVMRLMQDPNKMKATAYENGIALKVDDESTSLYYTTDGKYKTLKGFIGFDSEVNNKVYKDLVVKVKGDGVVFKEFTLNASKLYEEINLDVSGVKTLSFDLEKVGTESYEPIVDMVNMILE